MIISMTLGLLIGFGCGRYETNRDRLPPDQIIFVEICAGLFLSSQLTISATRLRQPGGLDCRCPRLSKNKSQPLATASLLTAVLINPVPPTKRIFMRALKMPRNRDEASPNLDYKKRCRTLVTNLFG